MAIEIGQLLLAALPRVRKAVRRSDLQALVWAVYGSACRAVARFKESEFALFRASQLSTSSAMRLDVMTRLAYLRSDERRCTAARSLIDCVVDEQRGAELCRALVDRAAVLTNCGVYAAAGQVTRQAI